MNHFDSFNPFILKGVAPPYWAHLQTLMVASLDEPKTYYGLIAKDIEVSETSITFTLNNTAYFHDHHPITAEDVAFSFKHSKAKVDRLCQLLSGCDQH